LKKVGIIALPGSNSIGIQSAFSRIGVKATILQSTQDGEMFEKLVLPGVGSFGPASDFLQNSGFSELIINKHQRQLPVLGICLGFQLFCTTSEEAHGKHGLGIIPAAVERLQESSGRRVPNMGWRPLTSVGARPGYSLAEGASFYFSHSFEVISKSAPSVMAHSEFGGKGVVAAMGLGNLIGVQFHPEKSHDAGLEFLKAFMSGGK